MWSYKGQQTAAFERLGDGPFLGKSLSFADDANHIIFRPSGGYGDSIALALWEVTTGKVVKTFDGPQPLANYGKNRADRFAYCKTSGNVFIGKSILGPNLAVQNIANGTTDRIFAIEDGVTALACFNMGNSIIVGSWHGYYSIIDAKNGRFLDKRQAYESSKFGTITIDDVSGSPDGSFVLTGIRNNSITGLNGDSQKARNWVLHLDAARIFRVDDGVQLACFNKSATVITKSDWDPLGKYLLFIVNHSLLFIWIIKTDYQTVFGLNTFGDLYSVSISPDGCHIAVCTSSGVDLFDVKQSAIAGKW